MLFDPVPIVRQMLTPLRTFVSRIVNNRQPPICEDVAHWGRERGLAVRILHDAIFGEISGFADGDPVVEGEIQNCEVDLRRPQALMTIEEAVVRELDGLVILPDGQFCLQGNWYRQQVRSALCLSAPLALPAPAAER